MYIRRRICAVKAIARLVFGIYPKSCLMTDSNIAPYMPTALIRIPTGFIRRLDIKKYSGMTNTNSRLIWGRVYDYSYNANHGLKRKKIKMKEKVN
jgi:hypothetical protein